MEPASLESPPGVSVLHRARTTATCSVRFVSPRPNKGRAVGNKELSEYLEVQGYGAAANWVYGQAIEPGDWIDGDLISLAEVRHVHDLAMAPVAFHEWPRSRAVADWLSACIKRYATSEKDSIAQTSPLAEWRASNRDSFLVQWLPDRSQTHPPPSRASIHHVTISPKDPAFGLRTPSMS